MIWAQLKLYVRRRNTTSKIKDVYNLVLEAINSITPEAWAECIRHVKEQEDYFWEHDLEMEKYENDELEDVDIGSLENILASDVAVSQYENPKCKLQKIQLTDQSCATQILKAQYILCNKNMRNSKVCIIAHEKISNLMKLN